MLEHEIYTLLESNGFKVPQYKLFKLNEVPSIDFYPIALKIHSSKIIHKSEYGAVKTAIFDDIGYKKAHDEILQNIKNYGVSLDSNDCFIATSMINGEELFCGVIDDTVFGMNIIFGKGGIFLELYKDICYIDIFANEDEIERAIKLTKISKIFSGFRNFKYDIKIIIDFIKNVQEFVKKNENIKELDLNPIILNSDGVFIVDARIEFDELKTSSEKPRQRINSFFDNSSIAVIGASSNPNKVGYAIAQNVLSFKGEVFFVNKKGGELFGKKCHKDIVEIASNIDMAIISIPPAMVLDEIKKLVKKDIKNIIVISAGFKEIGNLVGEQQIKDLADLYNINIIGPNCLGYYESTKNLNATFATKNVISGDIALLAQSGAVLSALMDKAYDFNIGFSHIVSFGNMIDLNFAQTIEALQDEPTCKYIAIYAEGIKDGKAFLQSVRNSKKPIFVCKTGKSELAKKAAFSHTGNLSGNYATFEGLLKSVGANMVDNIEALILAPKKRSNNILIITNAGGPATVLTDYIVARNGRLYNLSENDIRLLNGVLPSNWSKNNPIDIIGDARSDRFESVLEVIKEFEVDLVFVIVTPQFMTDALSIAKAIYKASKTKSIIPIMLGGDSLGDAKVFFKNEKMVYFDSLQEATSFL
ncbi:conserved hypothetical protein [Sulfurovum sp. enrichment culture clone C5]|uniref:CoA-binding domain-containing protein n=1 Tax=Sulfurovum sp. enrichment culture clone C5 TaxID=497650 RepID=A0A0S4XLF6_9BACT|nr:conserved hypothetical protein [Sulfurovum sp. enrichment culture clone C5]